MSANNFGHGACAERLDTRWPCGQAAVTPDGWCYWHLKIHRGLARSYVPEPKPVPKTKAVKR
jgi:hypothetical protein